MLCALKGDLKESVVTELDKNVNYHRVIIISFSWHSRNICRWNSFSLRHSCKLGTIALLESVGQDRFNTENKQGLVSNWGGHRGCVREDLSVPCALWSLPLSSSPLSFLSQFFFSSSSSAVCIVSCSSSLFSNDALLVDSVRPDYWCLGGRSDGLRSFAKSLW